MTDLEKTIREIARDVYADLGAGHEEKVYQRAMEVDLRLRGIQYDSERPMELRYKDHFVGQGYADLIVRAGPQSIVLELKTLPGAVCEAEKQQLRKYMRTLGITNGLLINFLKSGLARKKLQDQNGPQFENPD